MTGGIDPDSVAEPKNAPVAMPEWHRRPSGRPSLTAPGTVSPRLSFRVTAQVRDQAARIAKRQYKTLSRFAREALEARVEASLLEEAAQKDRLRERLRRRGPGVLDLPYDAYVEDVDDG